MSGTEEASNTSKIANIGEEIQEHQLKDTFRLNVSEYVNKIIPDTYFLTSGEAVQKTEQLIEDLKQALKGAKSMHKDLLNARKANKYLETEIDKGEIILRIKNPRDKKKRRVLKKVSIDSFQDFMGYGDLLYRKKSKDIGSKKVMSYCAIDPDNMTYAYFNTYNDELGEKQKVNRKNIESLEKFVSKLEKKGYERVLI